MSGLKVVEAFQAMSTPKALRALADELERDGEEHISVVLIIDRDEVDVRGLGTKTTVGAAYMLLDIAKQTLLSSEFES
jgi:hypothetical protein